MLFEIEPNLALGLLSSSAGGGGIRRDPLEVEEDERLRLASLEIGQRGGPNAGGSGRCYKISNAVGGGPFLSTVVFLSELFLSSSTTDKGPFVVVVLQKEFYLEWRGSGGRQELKLSWFPTWGRGLLRCWRRDVWGDQPIQGKGIRTKLIAAETGGTPHNDAGLRPLQEMVNYRNRPLGKVRESLR